MGQLAFLRQQQAGQHPVHARACPQAGRHRGDGQLRAPGVVRTGFGREARPLLKLGITIARPFMASSDSTVAVLHFVMSVLRWGSARHAAPVTLSDWFRLLGELRG